MKIEVNNISICELMDIILPGYWDKQLYTQMSYDAECKAVSEWCTINNYVLYEKCDEDYFGWEAFQLATTGRYDGVVLSNLS